MHERAEALGKAWNDLLASVSAIAEAKGNANTLRRAYTAHFQLHLVIADLQSRLEAARQLLEVQAVEQQRQQHTQTQPAEATAVDTAATTAAVPPT
ncbi:hypothetical protein D9Q98_010337 [Chlorella vulgaris]|uniref:Uncharacterized protein n=1 Tax=Chlorella vulgaris TaxID=3077 RepID=A0A9D4TK08_CHLVU|nr:hypothetical protein D9Q98_010337 [Chlorella vulgaris]